MLKHLPIIAVESKNFLRLELHSRYQKIRNYTEDLMKPLQKEDFLSQPVEWVSPPKWHLGHTTWFFENFILAKHLPGYQLYNDRYNYLFNSYYNNMGERVIRDQRGNLTRPSLEKVYEYRAHVDEKMGKLLRSAYDGEVAALIELGLNHEQQHQELFLTDFKYILACQPFYPAYREDFGEGEAESREQQWLEVGGGVYEIGYEGDGFCYDNEKQRHHVYLYPFKISNKLITNGQWMDFMENGGYEDFNLWHSDGWAWREENQIEAPGFWIKEQGTWKRFSLSGLQEIDPQEPVSHISFYEASAFAEYHGMRLPTEAEWEVAAPQIEWGQRWEWTGSAYLPYPGFQKAEGAVGEYNGKFMVNQMVLRGASVATSPNHSRETYRNFFHPPMRWQFTGLRLAQ